MFNFKQIFRTLCHAESINTKIKKNKQNEFSSFQEDKLCVLFIALIFCFVEIFRFGVAKASKQNF